MSPETGPAYMVNLFSTKVPRKSNKGRTAFSTDGTGTTENPYDPFEFIVTYGTRYGPSFIFSIWKKDLNTKETWITNKNMKRCSR